MIISNLKGGVGNQMFQIAAGYALAKRSNNQFAINYNLRHVAMTGKPPVHYRESLYIDIPFTQHVPQNVYNEIQEAKYNPITPADDLFLDGYFQSGKYFSDCKEEIKSLFKFPNEMATKMRDAVYKLSGSSSMNVVGMHVRRGDYTTIPTVLPPQDPSYYRTCLNQLDFNRDIVLVITDSPDYVISTFAEEFEKGYFVLSNAKSDLEDLCLLSSCHDIIMSNSSFSWWGTFLGRKKNFICAPSYWFGPEGPKEWQDIYAVSYTHLTLPTIYSV